jgi:hypothetical protein
METGDSVNKDINLYEMPIHKRTYERFTPELCLEIIGLNPC